MADLYLADAMDATEALFDPIWIPGQVVIDHEMRAALKIHAFAGGIVCDHYANERIGIDCSDGGASCLAGNAAMDHNDSSRLANPGGYLLLQVFERIFRFCEDDNLAPQARSGLQHQGLIKDRFELPPFG